MMSLCFHLSDYVLLAFDIYKKLRITLTIPPPKKISATKKVHSNRPKFVVVFLINKLIYKLKTRKYLYQ